MTNRSKRRRPDRKRSARTSPVSPFVLVVIGILVIGGLAVVLTGGGSSGDRESATSNVTVTGDALPLYGEGDDPAIGRPAPTVEGLNLAGEPVALGGDGTPRAVIFLAHWCPHCQAEVEALVEWADDRELPAGTELVSVSTLVDPSRPNFPPRDWLEGAGWPFPVLVDDADSSVAAAFGVRGTPFWVFIDGSGNVAGRVSGELDPDALAVSLEQLTAPAGPEVPAS